jgi:WD40 repeat protein
MTIFKDVFISYGRADSKSFTSQLSKQLSAMGVSVWFDFNDIPLATDFQERIDDGIAKAHNFLYIISPSSVNSPYCDKELQLARKYRKRIIPLMHVEEISSHTWKRRNPKGTEADWQAFQAAGKHRSFDNLDSTVRKLDWNKINWVEKKKEWDTKKDNELVDLFCQALVEIVRKEQDYVQHHTQLLNQALDWERHHRQTRYLLVGAERQTAERWLASRLTDEAFPYPAPLHCEFITESIKNAHNLMTQVFLCHSDKDQDSAEQIRQSLLRRGMTVWNYRTDIQTSQDYNNAIARGIEEADNIIFILSPQSASSPYCQHELDQALDLHKRVIPVLAATVEPQQVPKSLQLLQYIDLTDNREVIDYKSDESELLKLLDSDAAYHTEHKTWLTQALKWERQQHEPAMLLRGYNLRRANNWLQVARNHRYPPTKLQAQFIAASLRQPPSLSSDVFISYSRVDADFARRLNEALQIQGKRTWFDQESIAQGTDFQQEIYRGIESSDVFLFVLSPQSISSRYCADEVEYADRLNKRMVTVLHRPIDKKVLHPILADIQWLDFRDHDGDFQVNFQHLLRTLDTDREHLEAHTKLLGKALEWDRSSRDESLLLLGQNLNAAEQWLTENAEIEPKPTGIHYEYLRASRARQEAQTAAAKKLRRGAWIGGVAAAAGLVAAVGAGWFARAQIARARNIQSITEMEQLASDAWRQLNGDQTAALVTALKASQDMQALTTAQAQASDDTPQKLDLDAYPTLAPVDSLHQVLSRIEAREFVAHREDVWEISWSPDGKRMATYAGWDNVKLWSLTGELITRIDVDPGDVASIAWSPDGEVLATGGWDGYVRLWSLTGEEITAFDAQQPVHSMSWSTTSQMLATGSERGRVRLWSLAGEEIAAFDTQQSVLSMTWSPDGQTLAIGKPNGHVTLWTAAGEKIRTLEAHEGYVFSLSWSPDGQILATGGNDGSAKLWTLAGAPITTITEHSFLVNVSWSADGQTLATSGFEGLIKLWSREGSRIKTLNAQQTAIESLSWHPTSEILATGGSDGSIKLWSPQEERLKPFETQQGGVYGMSWSRDSQTLATSGNDGTVKLWTSTGELTQKFEAHEDTISDMSWSPDGQTLATGSWDGNVRLWTAAGENTTTLDTHDVLIWSVSWHPNGQTLAVGGDVIPGKDNSVMLWTPSTDETKRLDAQQKGVLSVSWSPNGQTLATGGGDGTVKLWTATGDEVATFKAHGGRVWDMSWSPDSQTLATSSPEEDIVKLWTLSGEKITAFDTQQSGVSAVTWNLHSEAIVTGGSDGSVKVWTLSGKQITSLDALQAAEITLSLAPDGQTLAIGGSNSNILLWEYNDFEALLASGCDWLKSYLISHPQTLQELTVCQTPETLQAAAAVLVAEGEELIEAGEIDEAIATFQMAKEWDPNLTFDPAALASRTTNHLLEKTDQLLAAKHFLSANQRLMADQPELALTKFREATALVPGSFVATDTLDWICRSGSLNNQAEQVLEACDEAIYWVDAERLVGVEGFEVRDSRGLARALSGNTQGAIADFQAVVDSVSSEVDEAFIQRRRAWIDELKAGGNPFTNEELDRLRQELEQKVGKVS